MTQDVGLMLTVLVVWAGTGGREMGIRETNNIILWFDEVEKIIWGIWKCDFEVIL